MYKKDTSWWDYYTENNSIYIYLYGIGNNELNFQFVLKVLYQTADR